MPRLALVEYLRQVALVYATSGLVFRCGADRIWWEQAAAMRFKEGTFRGTAISGTMLGTSIVLSAAVGYMLQRG